MASTEEQGRLVFRPNFNPKRFAEKPKPRAFEPTGRPVSDTFRFIGVVACLASFPAAVLLTAWALFFWGRTEVPDAPVWMNVSFNENLLVGAVFFWLELLAIVGALRIIADMQTARRVKIETQSQFLTLHEDLGALMDCIDDERYNFAVRLDTSRTSEGLYDTPLQYLEVSLRYIRNRFVTSELGNPLLHPQARATLTRIADKLDDMIQDCYWNTENAIIATRKRDGAAVDAALGKMFDECDTMVPDGLLEVFDDLFVLRGQSRPQRHA
jgi:hypothetical protein